jgi:hypothetical protein
LLLCHWPCEKRRNDRAIVDRRITIMQSHRHRVVGRRDVIVESNRIKSNRMNESVCKSTKNGNGNLRSARRASQSVKFLRSIVSQSFHSPQCYMRILRYRRYSHRLSAFHLRLHCIVGGASEK